MLKVAGAFVALSLLAAVAEAQCASFVFCVFRVFVRVVASLLMCSCLRFSWTGDTSDVTVSVLFSLLLTLCIALCSQNYNTFAVACPPSIVSASMAFSQGAISIPPSSVSLNCLLLFVAVLWVDVLTVILCVCVCCCLLPQSATMSKSRST